MTQRSYSYSQIQASYRCLRYFSLLHVDKLTPQVPHSGDMSFGTAIHSAVQACLEGDDPQDTFRVYWESEREQERRYGRHDWESLKNQGEILLSKFQRFHAKKFKIHKMEERIFTTYEGVRLEGTPDFVGEFDGVPSIVDFKTTGYPYKDDKLICGDQLPLYALMVKQEWNYPVEQLVYFPFVKGDPPKIQNPIKLRLDEIDVKGTVDNVLKVCRELDTRTEFHQNRGSCLIGTNRCDHWSTCFPTSTK
jgi:hypothetical protein